MRGGGGVPWMLSVYSARAFCSWILAANLSGIGRRGTERVLKTIFLMRCFEVFGAISGHGPL